MRTPILYVGPPGIGKTAVVRSRYEYTEVLLLSSCVEEDIAGLPYREGVLERRTVPRFIENLKNSTAKTKCLFLDELDKARREVADTLLSLITSPEIFGLPDDVDIIAAANPTEWGGGDGISQPMQSRFSIIDFVPDINVWSEYMLKTYPGNQVLSMIVEKIRNGEVPLLEQNGEGYNWRLSCPRTWELAIKSINQDNNDSVDTIISGLLTANCASALIACYNQTRGLPEIDDSQSISRYIGAKKVSQLSKPIRL